MKKINIEIFKPEQLTQDQYNFIHQTIQSYNGLVFHHPALHSIVMQNFHCVCYYYFAYLNDEPVGFCPCYPLQSKRLTLLHSNPTHFDLPYGGWVFNEKKITYPELLHAMPARFNQMISLWVNPLLDFPLNEVSQFKNQEFLTGFVPLHLSSEEIYNIHIDSKRRNMIRKAEKNGIIVKEGGFNLFDEFSVLLKNMWQKAGMPYKPLSFYADVLHSGSEAIKSRIFIAYKLDNPVAGVFLLGNQNCIHYWLGATSEVVENDGQGELLQWHAIQWAKSQGAKYYDLCVIEPGRLPQIAKFKSGFTKQVVPFYNIALRPLSYRVLNRLRL